MRTGWPYTRYGEESRTVPPHGVWCTELHARITIFGFPYSMA